MCANTLIALGLVSALATWGWPGPTTAILTMAFFVVVIAAVVLPGEGLRVLRKMLVRGLYLGTVLTAATGLLVALGALGFLLVVVVGGTAPGLRAGIRRGWNVVMASRGGVDSWAGENRGVDSRRFGVPDVQAEPFKEVVLRPAPRSRTPWLPEELASLDDVSLCMAWRSSFVVLEEAVSMEDRLVVIEHRQRCLDELQRRSPDGVAAWLSSGARASGNPLPYLGDHP